MASIAQSMQTFSSSKSSAVIGVDVNEIHMKEIRVEKKTRRIRRSGGIAEAKKVREALSLGELKEYFFKEKKKNCGTFDLTEQDKTELIGLKKTCDSFRDEFLSFVSMVEKDAKSYAG